MKKWIIGSIVFILVLIVLLSSIYTVGENEYAYVTQFSRFVTLRSEAGLYFKTPFVDSVKKLPKQRMLYDIPPSDVLTADKKTIVVDNFTVWQIEDPVTFMRTVAGISEMQSRIDAAVYNAVKNTMGSMNQSDIINSDNDSIDEVNKIVTDIVNDQIRSYGVSVVSVKIKRNDLPSDNEQAVYQRMISERTQIAESFRADGNLEAQKIKNQTDKQVGILLSEARAKAEALKGEAEQEYMRIMDSAYGTPERAEYYQFVRGLEALKVTIKGDKTIFLSSDSFLVKLLVGTE